MPCYFPIKGFRSRTVNKSGKRGIVFNPREGFHDLPVSVPCGQCIGCRLERSRQWAVRCMHEASLYSSNCFITLTFSDDYLCPSGSLCKADFQKFMKRLRKRFGKGVRYFHCGEYGEKFSRPHHHACLFNFDFPDKELWSVRSGVRLYRSAILEELWPFGYSSIGDVTFESAAYVARYCLKTKTGYLKDSLKWYAGRQPEYVTMSRRPGIAREWFESFSKDVYPNDFVVIRKRIKCKPPRYYDKLYDLTSPEEFAKIRGDRIRKARSNTDNSPARLYEKSEAVKLNLTRLRRNFENAKT